MADERVTIFIDGSNLYHGAKATFKRTDMDFTKLSLALASGRKLIRTYYYSAPVRQEDGEAGYQAQQKFFAKLEMLPYFEIRLGRLEKRGTTLVEKGIDVQIATDMILQAHSNAYDTAVLVSGDADYCPAIQAVKTMGKHVEVATTQVGKSYQLMKAADRFVELEPLLERCWIR